MLNVGIGIIIHNTASATLIIIVIKKKASYGARTQLKRSGDRGWRKREGGEKERVAKKRGCPNALYRSSCPFVVGFIAKCVSSSAF